MRPAYNVRDGHLVFDAMAVPDNTVIHGDCISVMAELPSESVVSVFNNPG